MRVKHVDSENHKHLRLFSWNKSMYRWNQAYRLCAALFYFYLLPRSVHLMYHEEPFKVLSNEIENSKRMMVMLGWLSIMARRDGQDARGLRIYFSSIWPESYINTHKEKITWRHLRKNKRSLSLTTKNMYHDIT